MSLLGFDAIGRLAIDQNPPASSLPAIYGGSFHIWSPAPRPQNFAKDFIAFAGHPNAGQFPSLNVFSRWDPPPRPRNFAKDWIAFSGNVYVETLPISSVFSPFDPPPHPRNFARDFIAFSGNYYIETRTLSFFTPFSNPPAPPHFAKDWIAFSGSEPTEDFPTFGIDFMPFSPGLTAKLWSKYGQQPQWWPNYFKAPLGKKRDRGGLGDWIPRRHRHPSVYSQEYYDQLRKRIEEAREDDEEIADLIEEIRQVVPNLLIPISRLIPPVMLPSLLQLPPYRPVPTLTMNPPEFHMATPEEIAADDEMIIRMLLED